MKRRFIFPVLILAMTAGLFMSCNKDEDETPKSAPQPANKVTLTAVPSSQKISRDGQATFTFKIDVMTLTVDNTYRHVDASLCTATINFEAAGGTVSPTSATTDENGNVTVVFSTPNPESFDGGTVTGSVLKLRAVVDIRDTIFQQGNVASATATVLPLNADEPVSEIVDDGLKKADQLNDNEFIIDGKKQVIGEWTDDYIYFGVKKDSAGVTRVIYIDFCKEHPENASVSGGAIHITPDMLGREIDMLSDTNQSVWMNLWTLKDINQAYNSETNPEINVNTFGEGKANLEKATVKFTQDPQTGACSALAYFKTKDGKEAYCKVKATMSAPWDNK